MQEYEQREAVAAPANEVFAWVSDVENLPKYLPPIKDAGIEGPAAAGSPGERVKMPRWVEGESQEDSAEDRNPL